MNNYQEREKKKVEISVCMACYNGEAFIVEQLQSILCQLGKNDEIIIVDDNSSDKTRDVINYIKDSRIHLYKNNKNLGVNKSFEKAIKIANGKYIFMSDQDDLWMSNRLKNMKAALQKYMLVSGNTIAFSNNKENINYDPGSLFEKESKNYKRNIFKIITGSAYYYGCAMAFSEELKQFILPFPDYIESHDLWIAMAANILKSNYHLENIVLKRRIHGNNASVVKRSFREKIYSRYIFCKSYFLLVRRIRKR